MVQSPICAINSIARRMILSSLRLKKSPDFKYVIDQTCTLSMIYLIIPATIYTLQHLSQQTKSIFRDESSGEIRKEKKIRVKKGERRKEKGDKSTLHISLVHSSLDISHRYPSLVHSNSPG